MCGVVDVRSKDDKDEMLPLDVLRFLTASSRVGLEKA